jgi:hypothetical protein
VLWITIKITNTRWEADLMAEMLTVHDIPSRVIDIGIGLCFGQINQAAVQVRSVDQWTALLLLSNPEVSENY